MPPKPRFVLADTLLLLTVLAVAAGLRVSYLLALADQGRSSGLLLVQDAPPPLRDLPLGTRMRGQSPPSELDALVHNLREHRWFGSLAPLARAEERTAHVSPGYPWLLALLDGVFGDGADRIVRWLQVLLGSATAGLYFLFAWWAFGSRVVAVLAGLFCALHPFWIVNSVALNDGTLTAFFLGLALCLGVQSIKQANAFSSLVFGLSLACLALLRATMLPFAFAAELWFLWRTRKMERGWLYALLAFLGFANGLAPWTLRNVLAHGEPVPVIDAAYLHLYAGNNPDATGGPRTDDELLTALAKQRGGVPVADVRRELAEMRQSRRYRSLAGDVFAYLHDYPANALQHRLEAAACFLVGESWLRERAVADVSGEGVLPAWLEMTYTSLFLWTLILMYPLVLIGWRWTYPWRKVLAPATLALALVPLPYLLGHAEKLHGPRLPLDGVLLTMAAFVVACLWPSEGRILRQGPTEDDLPKK